MVGHAGFGQYLLLGPVTSGMSAIRLRLRENPICLRSLRAFTVRVLAPHALRIMTHIDDVPAAATSQDAFLDRLSKVRHTDDTPMEPEDALRTLTRFGWTSALAPALVLVDISGAAVV